MLGGETHGGRPSRRSASVRDGRRQPRVGHRPARATGPRAERAHSLRGPARRRPKQAGPRPHSAGRRRRCGSRVRLHHGFRARKWGGVLALSTAMPAWQAALALAGAWAVVGLALAASVRMRVRRASTGVRRPSIPRQDEPRPRRGTRDARLVGPSADDGDRASAVPFAGEARAASSTPGGRW